MIQSWSRSNQYSKIRHQICPAQYWCARKPLAVGSGENGLEAMPGANRESNPHITHSSAQPMAVVTRVSAQPLPMPDLVVSSEESGKTVARNPLQAGNEITRFETALGEVFGQYVDGDTLGC